MAEQIADWFDDADTVRYLGGQQWLESALRFERPAPPEPGEATAAYAWLVVAADQQPVAVVAVAVSGARSAFLELAVAPTRRLRGVGKRVLTRLWTLPELANVDAIYGTIEADHPGAVRLAQSAGFTRTASVDGNLFVGRRPA